MKIAGESLEDRWRIDEESLEDRWRIVGGSPEDRWRIDGGSTEDRRRIDRGSTEDQQRIDGGSTEDRRRIDEESVEDRWDIGRAVVGMYWFDDADEFGSILVARMLSIPIQRILKQLRPILDLRPRRQQPVIRPSPRTETPPIPAGGHAGGHRLSCKEGTTKIA
ncbi:hypothetical protein EXE41_01075 [Halorubrum sp. SD690R]|uniref:hypothetical protein n=1 Tax=Halorubrum sp. SD690R TaxID=2518117 RepID=UPI0010F59906|nr:hypothetical protein [Halorubrum sp. SD690R]TKX48507.1 hypothetical protein EXE41_01075 [Halorubrum sp. SD690R]